MDKTITKQSRDQMVESLNTLLADEFTLYAKIRNFHWNVKGPHFVQYHRFFEELYGEVETHIDDTAERIRTLGSRPYSSLKEFIDNTRLKENSKEITAQEMLKELASDFNTMIENINDGIKGAQKAEDVGSEDYLTGILQEYQKKLWMISSMMG